MGDMNGRVGNKELGGVVERWGVEVVNENGEYLVDLYSEKRLFLANTFEHKTRGRGGMKGVTRLILYVLK